MVLEYVDQNYQERTGWKELVVVGSPGARLVETNAPATSLSNALANSTRADLLTAPPQQTEARVVAALRPGASAALNGRASKRFASRFTELLTLQRLSGPALLIALLMAFALGGAHALEPGHGKTVVAAYLVGSRGTSLHALWLGLIVTFTHTAGVFALGLVTLFASAYVVPERLYPWMGALSGVAITGVGLSLLWRQMRHGGGHEQGHEHEHEQGHEHEHVQGHEHEHEHGHAHTHAHGHTHAHEAALLGRGVPIGTLLALGISEGSCRARGRWWCC